MELIRYEVAGWGVGELGFSGALLVEHELPRPGRAAASAAHPLAERIKAYFAGEPTDFADVRLHPFEWTRFEEAVLAALRRVPYGDTVTYGELAALAGHPGAQRAVGSFCARSCLGLVVPCHRVVAAGGIGSYGSLGIGYKRRLLELEGVALG